jgi:hypothetical protein
MSPQRDRPLNDAECARTHARASPRFGSEYAMSNREEIDGFLASVTRTELNFLLRPCVLPFRLDLHFGHRQAGRIFAGDMWWRNGP